MTTGVCKPMPCHQRQGPRLMNSQAMRLHGNAVGQGTQAEGDF